MKEYAWKQALQAFSVEAKAIKENGLSIDKRAFGEAVDALKSAGRIGASGCGHSGIACMHFAHLMCCIERPARFISPAEAVHGGMGFLHSGDVLLLVSRGGKTSELLPMAEIAKKKNVKVISVTENEASPLAADSDIVIVMRVGKECDKYDSQGTSSFAVTSSIFDALQTALIEETGYEVETFALIHPGGAVGERLNK